jgi:hypothetical protein
MLPLIAAAADSLSRIGVADVTLPLHRNGGKLKKGWCPGRNLARAGAAMASPLC